LETQICVLKSKYSISKRKFVVLNTANLRFQKTNCKKSKYEIQNTNIKSKRKFVISNTNMHITNVCETQICVSKHKYAWFSQEFNM